MAKRKTPAAEPTAASAPVEATVEQTMQQPEEQPAEQPAEQQPEEQPAEQQPEEQPVDLDTVIVMCYPGTVDVMQKIWKKHLPEVNLIFKEFKGDEDPSLCVTLLNLISDTDTPAGFIFVPANVIPCSEMTFADVMIPVVYVKKSGERVYNSNLPMFVDKESMVETFDHLENTGQFPEEFNKAADEILAKAYLERNATRLIEVSHNFGNFVTLVARANPCIHTVIEGLLRRKFVTVTDPAGFAAITPELIKVYNLDTDNE